MSAVPAWQQRSTTAFAPAPTTGRPSETSQPRHLYLVPTGAEVRGPTRGWRLTRRGRLSLTVIAAAVAALSLALSLTGGSPSLRVDHKVSVAPGQTLSEVASRELPSIDIGRAVVRLQLLNRLSSAEVHAGQVLEIPSLP